MAADIVDPIPAATLVIFRDRDAAPPELLMVERAQGLAFAAGALVFPGGRIDPGDRALAALLGGDSDELAARLAAIRETIEEAGLPVGLSRLPEPRALCAMRASLHKGADFGDVLRELGLSVAPDALTPFARWCPRHAHMRIFDTRFYLARLPDGAPEARVDATENTRLIWASATEVLAMCDRGEASVIFPTRRNLERLAQFASFADAVADTRTRPIRTVTPWTEERGGRRFLCIPDDLGYPVTSEPMDSAMRG